MPLGLKPSCSCCRTGNTAMWRRSSQGDVVCNSCAIAPGSSGGHGNSVSKTGKPEAHRRSARLRNTKARTQPAADRKLSSKGKGRRHIFKLKNPLRAPEAVATVVTSDSILYQGVFYQVGDVVSVLDEEGELYFAQIRGFMQDQYCEKSAVITWLLPTTGSPKGKFDPSTYILGPEEELPRRMEFWSLYATPHRSTFILAVHHIPPLPYTLTSVALGHICHFALGVLLHLSRQSVSFSH